MRLILCVSTPVFFALLQGYRKHLTTRREDIESDRRRPELAVTSPMNSRWPQFAGDFDRNSMPALADALANVV